jgi:hypothetical protein
MFMAEQLTTGDTKTIKLEPILPPDSTNVSIASADYGAPPAPVVADDRMSVTFTVRDGLHTLVITLASRSESEETWQLMLDGGQVAMVTVSQHAGVGAININGTKAQ